LAVNGTSKLVPFPFAQDDRALLPPAEGGCRYMINDTKSKAGSSFVGMTRSVGRSDKDYFRMTGARLCGPIHMGRRTAGDGCPYIIKSKARNFPEAIGLAELIGIFRLRTPVRVALRHAPLKMTSRAEPKGFAFVESHPSRTKRG
jgi:hypothetical protein